MGVPLTIADYRHRGILKRFQVTPVSPFQILFSQGLIQLSSAIVSFIGVTLVYHLLFDFILNGSWLKFLLTYAFVILAMYSIGTLIDALFPIKKLPMYGVRLLTLPCCFFQEQRFPMRSCLVSSNGSWTFYRYPMVSIY